MPVPLNGIAETVQRLEAENNILSQQMFYLDIQIKNNADAILAMQPLAEWGPDEDYPASEVPPAVGPADPPTN